MQGPAVDDVFRKTTREQTADPELRRQCAKAIHHAATRLDAAYRLQMEAFSRARAEEVALLDGVIQHLRPALPALVEPLLVHDVTAPSRPALVHLRASLLFGEVPTTTAVWSARPVEGLFLLDDASFLRVGFTGAATRTGAGLLTLAADRLEALDSRRVLRDHALVDVTEALARALSGRTARRGARLRRLERQIERLKALRVLLGR